MIAAALSVGLLALGIPQTVDSIIWRYADVGGGAAAMKLPNWTEAVRADSALLEEADTWLDDPRARIRAGLLQLDLAYRAGPDELGHLQITRAVADLADGLARAPANGRAWMMLGFARLAAGDRDGARGALRASLLVADFDPALVIDRCKLGFALWPELDASERHMMREQVRDAWTYHPRGLVALARRPPSFYWVAGALAEDPEQLAGFLKMATR
jgi:hypothetical protein